MTGVDTKKFDDNEECTLGPMSQCFHPNFVESSAVGTRPMCIIKLLKEAQKSVAAQNLNVR